MDGYEYYDGLKNLVEGMRDTASIMTTVTVVRTVAKNNMKTAHPDSGRDYDTREFALKVELQQAPLNEVLQSGGALLSGDIHITSRQPLYATVNSDKELEQEGVTSDVIIWKGSKWRIVTAPDIPRLHTNPLLFVGIMRFVTKLQK